MSLTDAQQAYVYSKIDNAKLRIFGNAIKKPSDICKEMKALTGEEIDALIAKDKADALAKAQAKLAEANAEIASLS